MRIDSRKNQDGFTLIELVLVLVILSALALTIVPRLAGLEQESRLTVSVSNIADINRMIDTYNTLTKGKYPDGWDSLLDADDMSQIYAGNGDPLENSGVWSGWLEVSQISGSELLSMRRVTSNVIGGGPGGSIVTVYDHDPLADNAIESTNDAVVRELAEDDFCAFVDPTTSTGLNVYEALNLVPDPEFRVLALGIGPHVNMIGDREAGLADAPIADDVAPNQQYSYRRFVALFKVFTDQAPGLEYAQFMGTVTSYGKNAGALRPFMKS